MRGKAGGRGAALLLTCLALAAPARAAEPFVNLGFTSFVDGFGDPTNEGLAIVQYLRFSNAGSFRDKDGNASPAFVDPSLFAITSVTQLLYTLPPLGGLPGSLGIGVLVPAVHLDADFRPGGVVLTENGFGIGDVFVGPSIQFPPVMSGERPVFFHRFEFEVAIPIGNYERTVQINQGNNAWSLNPFWAATLLPLPGLEVSLRLHYLYNFENDEPPFPPPGAPAFSTTQAGQAFHANIAASIELVPETLRLGIASYVFKQFTDSRENGADVPGSREQVIGVGPGLVWFPTRWDLVFVNSYFETAVQNRFETHSIQVRWGHAFAGF